jgi:exodeoxyribonuclease VII small subunit
MSNGKAGKKKESFEASLEELEILVRELEAGEKPLEESLALFEKGVTLAKTLSKQLEEAKHKVEILVKEGGAYKGKDFEPEGD